MPKKIKFFLIFLAFMAVVSVSMFFDVFNVARSLVANDPVQSLTQPSEDEDRDGLSNADESYLNTDFQNPDSDGDGFLDGEEVASGHDPSIPGPDDAFIPNNLTDRLANLAIAGLAEGSLNPTSPNYDSSLDALTLSVMDDGIATFIPQTDISQIKLIGESTEEQEVYLKQISKAWGNFFTIFIEEAGQIEPKLALENGMANPEYIEYFSNKKKEFDALSQQWIQIPTPKNWLKEHSDFLSILLGLSEINKALAGGKDDPLRAAMGFSLLLNLADTNIPDTIEAYKQKVQTENLSSFKLFQ